MTTSLTVLKEDTFSLPSPDYYSCMLKDVFKCRHLLDLQVQLFYQPVASDFHKFHMCHETENEINEITTVMA